MDVVNSGKAVVNKLKEQGLWEDTKEGEPFKLDVPEELRWISMIYPKAYISHFPDWLKEEFAKRTERKFKVSRLEFTLATDRFLDGTVKTKASIEGRVILHD